jgi:hypothetical protein
MELVNVGKHLTDYVTTRTSNLIYFILPTKNSALHSTQMKLQQISQKLPNAEKHLYMT